MRIFCCWLLLIALMCVNVVLKNEKFFCKKVIIELADYLALIFINFYLLLRSYNDIAAPRASLFQFWIDSYPHFSLILRDILKSQFCYKSCHKNLGNKIHRSFGLSMVDSVGNSQVGINRPNLSEFRVDNNTKYRVVLPREMNFRQDFWFIAVKGTWPEIILDLQFSNTKRALKFHESQYTQIRHDYFMYISFYGAI